MSKYPKQAPPWYTKCDNPPSIKGQHVNLILSIIWHKCMKQLLRVYDGLLMLIKR